MAKPVAEILTIMPTQSYWDTGRYSRLAWSNPPKEGIIITQQEAWLYFMDDGIGTHSPT